MKKVFGFNCCSPKEIAGRLENDRAIEAILPLRSHIYGYVMS